MSDVSQPDHSRAPFLLRSWGSRHDLAAAELAAVAGTEPMALAPGLFSLTPLDGRDLLRLGLGRQLLQHLGRSAAVVPPFDPERVVRGSFRVRLHHVGVDARMSEAAVAREVWRRLRAPRVSLERPDTSIEVFVTPSEVHWGRLLHEWGAGAFRARGPRARPFWRSTALSPRRARLLLNLSGAPAGGAVLDPFCGTGAIPIEAALMGLVAHASDLDAAAVAGAARNFAHAGVKVDLRHEDARRWADGEVRFDAVVTDLPYGHAASLKGELREDLYRGFLRTAAAIVGAGRRVVVMARRGTLPLPAPGLRLTARFEEFVHASLTREIVVLARPEGREAGP